MLLLANGCSNTYGYEISETVSICHKEAYPNHVAKYFGMDYKNISTPGCSNDYIVRTTIDWIETNNVDPNELFVVIGWTSCTRLSFTNKKGEHFWSFFTQPSNLKDGLLDYYKSWIMNNTYLPPQPNPQSNPYRRLQYRVNPVINPIDWKG